MENLASESFIDELCQLSIAKRVIPDFEKRLIDWLQLSGMDIPNGASTHYLISVLDDARLVSLGQHVSRIMKS